MRSLQFGFRPIKALSTLVALYGYTYGWYGFNSTDIAR